MSIPGQQLDVQINQWVGLLDSDFCATRPFPVDSPVPFGEGGYDNMCRGRAYCQTEIISVADAVKRKKAVEDAGTLLRLSNSPRIGELLKKAYKKNDDDAARAEAGKALGYSKLRIWAHERPVAATAAGIAAAGAASGLGYAIFEYFSK